MTSWRSVQFINIGTSTCRTSTSAAVIGSLGPDPFRFGTLADGNLLEVHSLEPYSYRRATTGSTRIARRAGGYDARRATMRNKMETATK